MASQDADNSINCSMTCLSLQQRKYQISVWLALWKGHPVTCGFPSQRTNKAVSVSMSWRHYVISMDSTTLSSSTIQTIMTQVCLNLTQRWQIASAPRGYNSVYFYVLPGITLIPYYHFSPLFYVQSFSFVHFHWPCFPRTIFGSSRQPAWKPTSPWGTSRSP